MSHLHNTGTIALKRSKLYGSHLDTEKLQSQFLTHLSSNMGPRPAPRSPGQGQPPAPQQIRQPWPPTFILCSFIENLQGEDKLDGVILPGRHGPTQAWCELFTHSYMLFLKEPLSFLKSVGFCFMFWCYMNTFLASSIKVNSKERQQEKDPGIQLYRPNPLGRTTSITMEVFKKSVATWKRSTPEGAESPSQHQRGKQAVVETSSPARGSPGAMFWFGEVKTHTQKIFQTLRRPSWKLHGSGEACS